MGGRSVRDLTGQRFGRLVAVSCEIRTMASGQKRAYWSCVCDCGETKTIPSASLVTGCSNSCGCFRREFIGRTHKKHGMSGSRLYNIYGGMVSRCHNTADKDYKNYGNRGITVCVEWLADRSTFFGWALANGYSGNLSIDRVNNNKGYSPDNCRWATTVEQSRNKRQNVFIKIKEEVKTTAEWSKDYHIDPSTIWHRISMGWDPVDAVTKPIRGSEAISANA